MVKCGDQKNISDMTGCVANMRRPCSAKLLCVNNKCVVGVVLRRFLCHLFCCSHFPLPSVRAGRTPFPFHRERPSHFASQAAVCQLSQEQQQQPPLATEAAVASPRRLGQARCTKRPREVSKVRCWQEVTWTRPRCRGLTDFEMTGGCTTSAPHCATSLL